MLVEPQTKNRLIDEGVSGIPVPVLPPGRGPCAVGALLDNWVPVKVYQFNPGAVRVLGPRFMEGM